MDTRSAPEPARHVATGIPSRLRPEFFMPVLLSEGAPPRLSVVVDTEEEFDWAAPFSPEATGVSAVSDLWRVQDVLSARGIVPTYAVNYPVATTSSSVRVLNDLVRSGRCEIGAHLHPWVTPPLVERPTVRTTFGCNLGLNLEMDKILYLKEAIVQNLGVVPRVYRAGRHGFGATTAAALEWLDFDVDGSVIPHGDFSSQGGPSFEGFASVPGFFGVRRWLMELPDTVGFVGAARRLGPSVHRIVSRRWPDALRAVGKLARRSGTFKKLALSPETSTYEEMRALTDALFRDGTRTFVLAFHSPSLKPGCTPYVRTERDRDTLLRTIDRYCAYFLGSFGGVATTPARLYESLRPGARRAQVKAN